MKKIIAALLSLLASATAYATAPVGYCLNNVAQTISNGFIAPVPFASVTLCTAGSTSTNCAANIVSVFTTPALSTPTPTNPVVADAGGNYFFCAPVAHYAVLINGSVGGFFIPDITFVDDWSKGGVVTGTWQATSFVGPLTGNASTASASDHSPTQCGAGNYAAGVSTTWAANCNPLYYQTFEVNGTPLTQEPIANFTQRFSMTNITGATKVDINTLATGNIVATETANPGSSTACAQYDGNGNIGPGSCLTTPRTCNSNGCYYVLADGTVEEYGSSAGCGTGSNNDCTVNLTFPLAFPTGVDSMTATANSSNTGANEGNILVMTNSITTTTANLRFGAMVYPGGGGNNIDPSVVGKWRAVGH